MEGPLALPDCDLAMWPGGRTYSGGRLTDDLQGSGPQHTPGLSLSVSSTPIPQPEMQGLSPGPISLGLTGKFWKHEDWLSFPSSFPRPLGYIQWGISFRHLQELPK